MFAPEREYLAEILKDAGDDKFESEHFFPEPDYEKINNYFDKIDAWIKERRLDEADNFHRMLCSS